MPSAWFPPSLLPSLPRSLPGMTRASFVAKQMARKRYEEIRQEKKKEIDEFQANCEDGTVAFHISFDKFDADKSGAIDVEELSGAMFHMGLEVSVREW